MRHKGLLVVLGLLLAGGLAIRFTHSGRVAAKAVLVIPDLFPQAPWRPLDQFTPQPIRDEPSYLVGNVPVAADLYRPADSGSNGAVLMSLGVFPIPRRDPQVVGLAEGLARAGVVVMIPESRNLEEGVISPSEIDALVAAFQYLRSHSDVDPGRVGMAGFSVGASLLTIAAQDPRIRDQVRFVNSFGGYFDALSLMRAVLTRNIESDSGQQSWVPSPLTRQALTKQLVDSLADPTDRAMLEKAFPPEGPATALAEDSLSPDGRLVYRLLRAQRAEDVERFINELPQSTLQRLRALSPSSRIKDLRARLFVMHDVSDSYVPYLESRKLVAAAPPATQVHYTEFNLFEHVTPTRGMEFPAFLGELVKLFRHLYLVLLEVA